MSLFFAGCFNSVTYVHCFVIAPFSVSPGKFIWSTTSAPIRTPLLNVRPGTLSMRAGKLSAVAAPYGLRCIDYICLFIHSNLPFVCHQAIPIPTYNVALTLGFNALDGCHSRILIHSYFGLPLVTSSFKVHSLFRCLQMHTKPIISRSPSVAHVSKFIFGLSFCSNKYFICF
jgi:hypothetical protein